MGSTSDDEDLSKLESSCGKTTATWLPLFRIQSPGPTEKTKQCMSLVENFQLLFTTPIAEAIVQQMILKEEFSFCIEELLAFIGLNIAMGLIQLPQLQDYWNKDEVLATPFFSSIMSRDLTDSTRQKKHGKEGYDPLFKVRPLLDHFSAMFLLYYQPA